MYIWLPLIAGLLYALSRLPLHSGWISFLVFLPLMFMFDRQVLKWWQLIVSALAFSALSTPLLYSWVTLVTPFGLFGMFLLFSWYYFWVFYVVQRIWHSVPKLKFWGLGLAWIAFEYIQNFGELRFPWFYIGYSLADYLPLIQLTDLLGMTGLSAMIMLVNVIVYQQLQRGLSAIQRSGMIRMAGYLILIFGLWMGYGFYSLSTLRLVRHDAGIFVMQPSIKQSDKWEREEFLRILDVYRDLCIDAKLKDAKLLIFPEAAIPEHIMLVDPEQQLMNRFLSAFNFDIFTGFPHAELDPARKGMPDPYKYYNAAALFTPGKLAEDLYYKNILVPVGERIPWMQYFPILWKLQLGQANWEYGTELRYYRSGDYMFSPSICYEIAFPDLKHQMAAAYADVSRPGLRKMDYLVNITNDAWFGTSYGPWMHAIMTKFRAVENRIQIYRSANTGISMIVSPAGEVLAEAGLFEARNISAPLYTCKRIPLIRHIYLYPMILVFLTFVLFIYATIRQSGRIKT